VADYLPYLTNLARQTGQGLSFGFSDEGEAALRALAQGDPHQYRAIKDRIEAQRRAWAEANPNTAMGAETVGALVPGVVGAFVPGGQGATVGTLARLARLARAMDAPVERFAARVAPQALSAVQSSKLGRLAVGVADEAATGAAQSAGEARTIQDIPQEVLDAAPMNFISSLAVRGATGAGGLAVKRIRKSKK